MLSGVRDPREISNWDEEVDVLVVGLGAAGACLSSLPRKTVKYGAFCLPPSLL